MRPILFDLNNSGDLFTGLCHELNAEAGQLNRRHFPDGESYLQVVSPVSGRSAVVLCSLNRPDEKLLPLIFLAETLKELGAGQVILVAPYLAYMRQDHRFNPGECVSSVHFARLISQSFDALVTVDPHLHRYHSLDQIYFIPSAVVASAEPVARWIQQQVYRPLLIGPDSESEQWVAQVAALAGAPCEVLEKQRHGDRSVTVSVPHPERYKGHTPVLLDDIISSGRTLLETLNHLQQAGMPPAVCIASHALFDDTVFRELQQRTQQLITCNTVSHPSNAIDLSALLADAVQRFLTR